VRVQVSTVANFFMNARRRSLDKYIDDGPAPAVGGVGGGAARPGGQQAAPPALPPHHQLQQQVRGDLHVAALLDHGDNAL